MLNNNLPIWIIKKYSYLFTILKKNRISHEITSSCAYIPKKQLHSFLNSSNGPWKVLFFGSDNFALESLRSLYCKYRDKKLCRLEVVSTHKKKKNVVMQYAEENRIIVNKWPLDNHPYDFDIGIVVSFGHLIPVNIINSFPLGMLNVHASLLPRWRGAAPIIYSIINGDTQTGITIMKIMPEKFDVGEVVAQKKINIHADETLPELYMKLEKVGANVLIDVIERLPQVLLSAKPQEKIGITYAPKVTSKISLVKWDEMTAKNVYDLYRGLLGLYPLTTKFDDTAIKLFDVQQVSKSTDRINPEDDVPGFVKFDKRGNILIVTCKGPSWVSVKKVILSGRSLMYAIDFRNGFMRDKTKSYFFRVT